MPTDLDVPEREREAILRVRPDLAGTAFRVRREGWDSVAVQAGDWLFKFPAGAEAAARLRREPHALALVRERAPVAVPRMRLHEAPVLFSEHRMIPGEIVPPARWADVTAEGRERLADDLAAFFVAVHAVPLEEARAAGAVALRGRPGHDAVAAGVRGRLGAALEREAEGLLAAHRALPPDEPVFGQFDTHGWNMAYDFSAQRLNGLFDFADAGIGGRHLDLSYPAFVAVELAVAVVRRVERLTGRPVDVRRVVLEHGFIRLADIAAARTPEEEAELVMSFGRWVGAAQEALAASG